MKDLFKESHVNGSSERSAAFRMGTLLEGMAAFGAGLNLLQPAFPAIQQRYRRRKRRPDPGLPQFSVREAKSFVLTPPRS